MSNFRLSKAMLFSYLTLIPLGGTFLPWTLYDYKLLLLWRTASKKTPVLIGESWLRQVPSPVSRQVWHQWLFLAVLIHNLFKTIVSAHPSSLGFFSHCHYSRYLQKIRGENSTCLRQGTAEADACQALSRDCHKDLSFRGSLGSA